MTNFKMKLNRTILFAKDVPTLSTFYREVLGLQPVKSEQPSEEWMLFDTGSAQLALHSIPDVCTEGMVIESPPKPRHGSLHKLVFIVDDIEATRDELLAKNVVQMESANLNTPNKLERCDFIDPEGNVFQISSE